MAPAVPFALLGIVQLASVAAWLGIAAASCFPLARRRTTPLVVLGGLAMAAADAITALRFGHSSSELLGALRVAGIAGLGAGLAGRVFRSKSVLPGVLVPLGTTNLLAGLGAGIAAVTAAASLRGQEPGRRDRIYLAAGLGFTAVAFALTAPASSSYDAALAVLAARAAAALALLGFLVLAARTTLLGKVVGAIVAGVVAMALGSVAVVGTGVAAEVQHDQSTRLLSVAKAQQASLNATATRAGLFAKVVALCPQNLKSCNALLKLFASDPGYFAIIEPRSGSPAIVAPNRRAVSPTALVEIAGSSVVKAALSRSSTSQTVASGPVLVQGSPQRVAVIAAVPGRPTANAQTRPTFAAIYGIPLVDSALRADRASTGYDVSVVVAGRIVASSLGTSGRRSVAREADRAGISELGPQSTRVVAANGASPTVAFVPVTEAGNDGVRIATLAVSQPASVALAAQRSVLRRLILTALVVLALVAAAALLLAQRIAEPVRRLTVAAGRVRRGDLDARADIASRDEVGVLARSFDAMTSSLRGMTGELREAAIAESTLRIRLETILGSMTDGLIVTDDAGLVTSANPKALQMLGSSEVIGQSIDSLGMFDSAGSHLLDGRSPATFVREGVISRDDRELPVRAAVAPLADGGGRVVVIADRTREQEVERLKSEFLANVSHELRTPLTPIRGYAEMLTRRPDLPTERVSEFVGEISASAARMNRIVELLVDVAYLDSGRVSPQRRAVLPASIVDERLAVWRDRYPERADDFKRRVSARLPSIDVDPQWLGKALDELVDNAAKYTDRGTSITIAATKGEDGSVRLAVRDAGDGVDADRLGELLGDFSQADASETRAIGGLGLGLGFVTRVAEQFGMTLRVTSRRGRGSEFALDVPVPTSTPGHGR